MKYYDDRLYDLEATFIKEGFDVEIEEGYLSTDVWYDGGDIDTVAYIIEQNGFCIVEEGTFQGSYFFNIE